MYHFNNREKKLEELKLEFMIKAELAAYKSSDPKVKKQTFREKVNAAIYEQVAPFFPSFNPVPIFCYFR